MKLQTPADLARLVKNARTHRNLTQQEVADAAGITRQSFARIERGVGKASFDTVLLILDRLEIQLEAATEPHKSSTTPVASHVDQAAVLSKRFSELLPRDVLDELNDHIKTSLPVIDQAVRSTIESSDGTKLFAAQFNQTTLDSFRAAARALASSTAIPGSVLGATPRPLDSIPAGAEDSDPDTEKVIK